MLNDEHENPICHHSPLLAEMGHMNTTSHLPICIKEKQTLATGKIMIFSRNMHALVSIHCPNLKLIPEFICFLVRQQLGETSSHGTYDQSFLLAEKKGPMTLKTLFWEEIMAVTVLLLFFSLKITKFEFVNWIMQTKRGKLYSNRRQIWDSRNNVGPSADQSWTNMISFDTSSGNYA